jgi:protein-tyrosine phosphatase
VTGGGAAADAALSVLVVCTGNICRSPAAELLLRAGLPPDAGVVVGSAGLNARVGEPVAEPMARLLVARGLDPGSLAGRQLTPDMLRQADLVLTMSAQQRSAAVGQVPAAVRRTFTLREFADLAALSRADAAAGLAAPAARLAALVRAAPTARARREAGRPDDIEDPYGRPDAVHAEVLAAIEEAVTGLLGVLVPAREHAR